MTTYFTNNPIGSVDVKDLYDNAQNLDIAVNDVENETWIDRLGVPRKSWWGMEQDFQQFLLDSGYVNIGDYAPGLEITARNQIFWRDGELYRAGASLSLPYTTTGDWITEEGLFVAVGDASLRQELSAPGGSSLVGSGSGTVLDALNGLASSVSAVSDSVDDLREYTVQGASLVDKILSGQQVRGMYVRRINESNIGIGFGLNLNLRSVVEFQLTKDADKLWLLRGVRSGTESRNARGTVATLDGTYNEGAAPATFTTTVGDKWSASFEGQSVWFRRRTEDRGGLWQLTLQPLGLVRNVSCYSEEAINGVEELVFSDLPFGQYRVDAEFLGEDPLHPPAGGVAARGYVNYRTGSPADITIRSGIVAPIDVATSTWLVSPNSIPDFAISARPESATYPHNWVPAHGADVGQTGGVEVRLNIDGLPVISFDPDGSLPLSYLFREIKSVELMQMFSAFNSDGSDGAMWQQHMRHSFKSDAPVINIQNRIRITQPTSISVAYFGMLPVATNSVNRLVLNNGTEIEPVPLTDVEQGFGLDTSSVMFAGEFAPGNYHAAACDVTLRDAVSYGKMYQPTTPGRISFRADNVAKIYWTAAESVSLNTGDVMRCEHRIAAVSGVRSPNYDLRSI